MGLKISQYIHNLKSVNLNKRLRCLLSLTLLFLFSIDIYSQTKFSIIIPNFKAIQSIYLVRQM